ncbi:MAG: ClbS/DfsB family four-helix bundle protein [Chloroflexi bacterium]|nr:MAG: ClbS/DfsB family four-helix bundle protein [Chloroflexota bacterium]
MDRTDLLTLISNARTRLESALARLTPAQMTEPDLPSNWSVKDLLAHLGRWEERAVYLYATLVRGDSPETIRNEEEVDAFNAETLEMFRPRSLDEVREYERTAYNELLHQVETAPEEDLFDPTRFAWTDGQPFVNLVSVNTYDHYAEHMPALDAKLAEDREALRPPAVESPLDLPDYSGSPPGRLNPVVQLASEFLGREGRNIDLALYHYHFGAKSVESVLDVLAHHQNEDGGFRDLEVDIHAPVSNPFATEIALVILTWIDPPRDHPLVKRLVSYLETTQDEEGNWTFTPEVYQYELAPWFQGWQWPNLNPSCSLAGLLKELGLGSDLLHKRVQSLFDRLANPADLVSNEFYAARPYAYYFQTEWNFPMAELYRSGAVWWLIRQHLTNPDLDATHFIEYAPNPESAVAKRLPPDVLKAKLDQLLTDQSGDGGWTTPYDPRWRPWVTIRNLMSLRAYGRI